MDEMRRVRLLEVMETSLLDTEVVEESQREVLI